MNAHVVRGKFFAVAKTYRSEDGRHYFRFKFVPRRSCIDIYCLKHPRLNGRDPDVHKTHLYASGKVCFVSGKEPRTQREAECRAKEWAEYFLSYLETGRAMS